MAAQCPALRRLGPDECERLARMDPNRRRFLRSGLGLAAAAMPSIATRTQFRMGVGTACYMQRAIVQRDLDPTERFTETLSFLAHCRDLGAGGIQASLTSLDESYAARLRKEAEKANMYVEVSARLPLDDAGSLDKFERTVRAARVAGASVIRTVMLGGRRYETFESLGEWRDFGKRSWESLVRAEPVLRRHKVRLAIENHKDWRIDEMLSGLDRIQSEAVGVTIDTGNNMSLLEDPLEVARAFAPYAFAVHLKDMGLETYEDGFLLSEVPFGKGCLDLRAIVDTIRAARPDVRFTLEMITRDPLKVPCLKEEYWTTMGRVPGRDLAATLRTAREKGRPLPRIGHLPEPERLRVEEANNLECLEYGRAHLGL